MAAPTIRGVTQPAISNTGTSTSPSSTAVGDLVLVFVWSQCSNVNTCTHTLQSGYREIRQHAHNDGSTDGRLSVACIVATSGGAQDYTPYAISGATSNQTNAGMVVIEAGTWDESILNTTPDPVPSNSATTTGTGAPNPPASSNVYGDVLMFAIGAWYVGSAASTTTSPPTNYTERIDGPTGSHVTHLAVATRERLGLAASTEDPGAFSDNVTPSGSAHMSFAIRGALAWRHGIKMQLFGQGGRDSTPEGYAQLTMDTTNGATWIIGRGGKTGDQATAPTDSRGNTFTLIDSVHEYDDWAGYGSSAWICSGGTGGPGHQFQCNVTLDDEHTFTVVEVVGDNLVVEDAAFKQIPNASAGGTHQSDPVTTAGPATLIAHWWGANPVGGGNHIVTANNGFVLIDSWGIDNANGYVQHYVFAKTVGVGGTYDITFTQSPAQGAQSLLIAVAEQSAVSSADGTADGAATASGSGSAIGGAVGTPAGMGSAAGEASATAAAGGASGGSASVTGDEVSLGTATGTVAGIAAASGSASAVAEAAGTTAGIANSSGASSARAGGTGDAAGGADTSGAGTASALANGDADGATTVAGAAGAVSSTTGSAAGAATVTGDAAGALPGGADGTSSGSASATGAGAATAFAAGSSPANASAAGASSSVAVASGSASSVAAVVSDGKAIAAAASSAAGSSAAIGQSSGIAAAIGTVTGSSASAGDAASLGISAGTSTGNAVVVAANSAVAVAHGQVVAEASVSGDATPPVASAPTIAVTFVGGIDVRWARDRVATIFVEDDHV